MLSSYNVIPVLLGGDLNAYSVALSFKQKYGINSHVFTRYRCGATENSRFITTHLCSGLCDYKVALPELLFFASKHKSARLILIPCSDNYLPLMYTIRKAIEGIYHFCIPKEEDYLKLTDKASFYEILIKNKINAPKTVAVSKNDDIDAAVSNMPFGVVIKPSSSTEYNKNVFEGMKKVYFENNPSEAKRIIERIFASGYNERVLIQEKLNAHSASYVLTTLSGNDGEVVRASLGKVVLMERGDTSYGNYSAIITEPLDTVSLSLIKMLNKMKYCGIANFDIMREGNLSYVLELNARQGRSSDYLRAAGISLAEYFLKTAVLKEKMISDFSYKEIFWHYSSDKLTLKYIDDERDMGRILELIKMGESYSPFENCYEGLARRIYSFVHGIRRAKRLKTEYKRAWN